MKVVINLKNESREDITKIIDYFICYGYDEFIVFSNNPQALFTNNELSYYRTNQISVIALKKNKEETKDLLHLIRGGLNKFFVVFSEKVTELNLDQLLFAYKENATLATLGNCQNKLVVAILENEIFDYFPYGKSLERDVLSRVGEDEEISIYTEK